MGGSMYVHTFGAYFGLAASYFFDNKKAIADEKKRCEGDYNSQLIAMVGTLFLWMFWPSFNGALAADFQQQRVIVNTVMAISASCITACGVSRLWMQRLDMEVVLNATLAGGVSVGSSSDLVVTAGTAMGIGALAGIISAVGFLRLSAMLREKINLSDENRKARKEEEAGEEERRGEERRGRGGERRGRHCMDMCNIFWSTWYAVHI